MKQSIRIGNGAGFWGDNLDAPVRLVEKGKLDYLTLEYLAELTLSILAHQRKLDPKAGYVGDFPKLLKRLAPFLKEQPNLRIVTNAGGLNPQGCAKECAKVLAQAGLGEIKIAWVAGDDLMDRIPALAEAGERFAHFDSGAEMESLEKLVSANAYMGAAPIAEALDRGARIVVTGRVADASLTVGPAMHEFKWAWTDWNRLAAASVAGHLIECGAQVTGGLLTRWQKVKGYDEIGYPICELSADGEIRITKVAGTGGMVNRETVTEQLLYEIGDPEHYLTPDVDVDFTGLEVEELGKDLMLVKGAEGRPAPQTLKVSCAYENGYSARGDLVVCGEDAEAKARACGRMILERVRKAGYALRKESIEILGTGECLPGVSVTRSALWEVVLRVAVWDPSQEAVERFCREITPLITSGPPGLSGYAGSRVKSRRVLSYWPTTIDRKQIKPMVEMHAASQLAAADAGASASIASAAKSAKAGVR